MEFQDKFNELITGGKTIKGNRCYIDVQLDGEVDFSPLKNKSIEEIYFVDGNISRIHNIPKGIKKIVINENKLEELPTMELRDLVHLEANNNKLSNVNLSEMVNLASLFLNNNKIRKIHNFPASLKTLHINGNMLDELNLNEAGSCTDINCQQNPMLQKIISGKQFSNPEFNLNKDPHTVIVFAGGSRPSKPNIDVKTAVNDYYELKKKYEESKKNVFNQIKSKDISKQKKIKEIRNAKFKCINCGKDGGTQFWKDENYLKAMCGNKENPCKLDLVILSSLTLSDSDIHDNEIKMKITKENIIKLKMNTLFGYINQDTSVELFEKYVNAIKNNDEFKELANEVNYSYVDMQNDSKKISFITRKMKIIYAELAEIRRLMDEYNKTENKHLLRDVASKQVDINNALKIMRSIKYPIHEIVEQTIYNRVDDEGNFVDESKASKSLMNVLKQYPYSFDDFLNPNLEKLKVLKFDTK